MLEQARALRRARLRRSQIPLIGREDSDKVELKLAGFLALARPVAVIWWGFLEF